MKLLVPNFSTSLHEAFVEDDLRPYAVLILDSQYQHREPGHELVDQLSGSLSTMQGRIQKTVFGRVVPERLDPVHGISSYGVVSGRNLDCRTFQSNSDIQKDNTAYTMKFK